MAKYKPEYADRLPKMFSNGESVAEVCLELGISRRAFYDWVDKHPDFAAAYEDGKTYSESWWNKLGRAGATGKVPIQPTVWIFNMKNRFDWKDKTETDLTSSDGSMTPSNLSDEGLAAELSKYGIKPADS
jgi:transposase